MADSEKLSMAWVLKGILDIVFCLGLCWGVMLFLVFTLAMVVPRSEKILRTFTISTMYHLDLPADALPATIACGDPHATMETRVLAWVTYHTSNRWFLMLSYTGYLIWWVLLLVVVTQLRRFLKTVAGSNPFDPENFRRIRIIGWGIIAATLLQTAVDLGAVTYLRSVLSYQGTPLFPPLALIWDSARLDMILVGAVVLVIAEIFRRGSEIQEDQALTI